MSRQARHFYQFGPFRLDTAKRVLLRDGEMVQLPPKVVDILLVLVENVGEIVDKQELMNKVWPDSFVEEGNLHVNISALRKVLGDDGQHQYIKTIPKRGYRFVASVVEVLDQEGDAKARAVEPEQAPPSHTVGYQQEPTGGYLGIGAPGQITASRDVSEALAEQKEARARPSFERPDVSKRVSGRRDIRPVLAFSALLLGLATLLAYFLTSGNSKETVAGAKIQSIAVLPFKTISAEYDDEYLGAGMADALISALNNIREITVRPIRASLKYTSTNQDPAEVGQSLRVDAILEGTIRRVGGSLRITAQLVRVEDGSRVWEMKSSDEFQNLLTVQNAIAIRAVQALGLELSDQERFLVTKRHTDNLEAYRLYLKGRHLFNQRTQKDVKEAIESFEQAINLDPNYALAYSGLAQARLVSLNPMPPIVRAEKTKEAAIKALELDDTLAEAHAMLGRAKLLRDWDWAGSEEEFKRAIEISPNYTEAHYWYSYNLSALGRHEEAIEEIKRIQEIDPFAPRNALRLGLTLYLARQYDWAIEELRKTPFEIDSAYYQAYWRLGMVYVQKGMHDASISMFKKAELLSGEMPLAKASLAYAYAKSGNHGEARKILDELERVTQQIPSVHLAAAYAYLGDKDKAFEWLERAYELRDQRIIFINVEPMLDSLRSDPRFEGFLRRIGLAP